MRPVSVILIFVLMLIFSMTVLVAAAPAKDQSRMEGKGDLPTVTYFTHACITEVTITRKHGRTIARKHLWYCRLLPPFLQPTVRVSWTNVFRELQRSRDCGVPAFTYARCRG